MSGPKMHPAQFMSFNRAAEIKKYEQLRDQAYHQHDTHKVQYYKDLIDDQKQLIIGDDGEKFVFDTLRKVLPEDWIVFHSFVLYDFDLSGDKIDYRHEHSYNRELDFVLINPKAGIFILEVKNWGENRVEQNEKRAELSKANHEKEGKENRTPLEQAASAARTLEKWLTVRHHLNIRHEQFAAVAWMTHKYSKSQELNKKYLKGRIEDQDEILSFFNSQIIRDYSPDSWDWQKVVELLSHAERYRISLDDYDRIMTDATAKINNLLPMLSHSMAGIAVEGCAGSGKTVMAIREASRLATQGHRVLYVCYTANLPEWLKVSYKNELRGVPLEVLTFHGFCRAILGEYNPACAFKDYRDELCRKIQQNPEKFQYDYIFVDEAQDFETEWWRVLSVALANRRKNNPEAMFYLFFDKNQHLRNAGNPPPLPVRIALTTNLRNSAEIAKYSAVLLPNDKISALDLSCQEVEIHKPVESLSERNKKIRKLIENLTGKEEKFNFSKKDIVVLSPFRNTQGSCFTDTQVKEFLSLPDDPDRYRIQKYLFSGSPKKVLAETILRFKGLEAPVIILTDFMVPVDENGEAQRGNDVGTFTRNSFYVACTRAKFMLHIIPMNQQAADYANRVLKLSENKIS